MSHSSPCASSGGPLQRPLRRSPPHLLFVIDEHWLSAAADLTNTYPSVEPSPTYAWVATTICRILYYFHAQVDGRLSWACRWVDLETGQGIYAGDERCTFELVNPSTIDAFLTSCQTRERQTRESTSLATRRGVTAGLQARSPLDSLRNLLTHIEGDYPWYSLTFSGFSPTRTGYSAANEARVDLPIPIKNYIYFIGGLPRSAAELVEWAEGVCSPTRMAECWVEAETSPVAGTKFTEPLVATPGGDALIQKVHQSLLGRGLWQNYLKKRIAINWINTANSIATFPGPQGLPVSPIYHTPLDRIHAEFTTLWEAFGGALVHWNQWSQLHTATTPTSKPWLAPLQRSFIYPKHGQNIAQGKSNNSQTPPGYRSPVIPVEVVYHHAAGTCLNKVDATPTIDTWSLGMTALESQSWAFTDNKALNAALQHFSQSSCHGCRMEVLYESPPKAQGAIRWAQLFSTLDVTRPYFALGFPGYTVARISPRFFHWASRFVNSKIFAIVHIFPTAQDAPQQLLPCLVGPCLGLLYGHESGQLLLRFFLTDITLPAAIASLHQIDHPEPLTPETNREISFNQPYHMPPFSWDMVTDHSEPFDDDAATFPLDQCVSHGINTENIAHLQLPETWSRFLATRCGDQGIGKQVSDDSSTHVDQSSIPDAPGPMDGGSVLTDKEKPMSQDTPQEPSESQVVLSPMNQNEFPRALQAEYEYILYYFQQPFDRILKSFSHLFEERNVNQLVELRKTAMCSVEAMLLSAEDVERKYRVELQGFTDALLEGLTRDPTVETPNPLVSGIQSLTSKDSPRAGHWTQILLHSAFSDSVPLPDVFGQNSPTEWNDILSLLPLGPDELTRLRQTFTTTLERYKLREFQFQMVFHLLYLRLYRVKARITKLQRASLPPNTSLDSDAIVALVGLDSEQTSADRKKAKQVSKRLALYVDKLCIWSMVGFHKDLFLNPTGNSTGALPESKTQGDPLAPQEPPSRGSSTSQADPAHFFMETYILPLFKTDLGDVLRPLRKQCGGVGLTSPLRRSQSSVAKRPADRSSRRNSRDFGLPALTKSASVRHFRVQPLCAQSGPAPLTRATGIRHSLSVSYLLGEEPGEGGSRSSSVTPPPRVPSDIPSENSGHNVATSCSLKSYARETTPECDRTLEYFVSPTRGSRRFSSRRLPDSTQSFSSIRRMARMFAGSSLTPVTAGEDSEPLSSRSLVASLSEAGDREMTASSDILEGSSPTPSEGSYRLRSRNRSTNDRDKAHPATPTDSRRQSGLHESLLNKRVVAIPHSAAGKRSLRSVNRRAIKLQCAKQSQLSCGTGSARARRRKRASSQSHRESLPDLPASPVPVVNRRTIGSRRRTVNVTGPVELNPEPLPSPLHPLGLEWTLAEYPYDPKDNKSMSSPAMAEPPQGTPLSVHRGYSSPGNPTESLADLRSPPSYHPETSLSPPESSWPVPEPSLHSLDHFVDVPRSVQPVQPASPHLYDSGGLHSEDSPSEMLDSPIGPEFSLLRNGPLVPSVVNVEMAPDDHSFGEEVLAPGAHLTNSLRKRNTMRRRTGFYL
ncbi:hypothetical protein IWQ62_000809 [Dispira parvispora]|uniref:DNA replication regulator Sld3 C-terminal domain-containing protein n=1 Tax=Dispira parvispora TaxID=1520584 RepID=A0A9W8AV39_9FUNG|nr:hypothetical protein IWQ62_000809 [Dispira parvispora]